MQNKTAGNDYASFLKRSSFTDEPFVEYPQDNSRGFLKLFAFVKFILKRAE